MTLTATDGRQAFGYPSVMFKLLSRLFLLKKAFDLFRSFRRTRTARY